MTLHDPMGHKLIDIPEQIKTKSFVVIDLDYLCFKVASVLEERCINVFSEDTLIGKYKNRTEFKKSDQFSEEYTIEDCQSLKNDYKTTMVFLLRKLTEDIKKATDTQEVVLAAGGTENFRDSIPSPQKYKGHRDSVLRPLALKECKDYATNNYITVEGEGMEADDVISMFQFRSYYDKEYKIVVAAVDKDALQTHGYLYNPETSKGMAKSEVTLIEGLGEISLKEVSKKRKAVFHGRKTLYFQLLHGDMTDNYDPSALHKKLIGSTVKAPVLTDLKAYNILKDCKTDKECLQAIHDVYLKWYKDIKGWEDWQGNWIEGDYLDLMQCYWDYCFMTRFPGDKVNVRELLTKMEILWN